MKSLNQLNNVEKGKLLADLFPNELLKISEYIQAHHKMLSDNEDEIRKNWDTNIITVDMWYRLAQEVSEAIKQNGKKLLKSRCFADQLFDGYLALFTIDCISKYASNERKDSNFYHLVNAFFNLDI